MGGVGWWLVQYTVPVPGTGTVLVWLVAGCTEIIEKSLPTGGSGWYLKSQDSKQQRNSKFAWCTGTYS